MRALAVKTSEDKMLLLQNMNAPLIEYSSKSVI